MALANKQLFVGFWARRACLVRRARPEVVAADKTFKPPEILCPERKGALKRTPPDP
jgi:hypothetical protein